MWRASFRGNTNELDRGNRMKYVRLLILFSFFISYSSYALLEVSIIKTREAAFPIVIAPFEFVGKESNMGYLLAAVYLSQ